MRTRKPTLKDLAQALKLSVATVSRALQDRPDISPETKSKVLALAVQFKYQPNPLAQHLRLQKSNTIGVVIPKIVHYYLSTIISGVLDEAHRLGYQVLLCESRQLYAQEVESIQTLLRSGVDGILLDLSNETSTYDHIRQIQDAEIPLILFDKVSDEIEASKVVVDDFEAAFQAVAHLIQQGYRRIAHIMGPHCAYTSKRRLEGYQAALQHYDLPHVPSFIAEAVQVNQAEGYMLMQNLLNLSPQLDAVFAITDEVALGAMEAAQSAGKQIPTDFGVIGFSDWQLASVAHPPLSSVYQPGFELGQVATKCLIESIEAKLKDEAVPLQTHILKTSLRVRTSSLRTPVPSF